MGAIRTITLNVPGGVAAGTAADVSGFRREGRTIIITGDVTDDITDIQASFDGTTFRTMRRVISPATGPISIGDVPCTSLRLNRVQVGAGSALAAIFGGEGTETDNSQATQFQLVHAPAAATQATASQAAAGAGLRNYLTALQATIATVAATAQTPINVNVRDGATGAGNIIWSGAVAALGTTFGLLQVVFEQPLRGAANTIMTVEFAAAGVANSIQTVAAQGFIGV